MNFTDSNGTPRHACILITDASKTLPLLVWLHPSLSEPTSILETNLVLAAYITYLSSDGGPCGYNILLPFGRNTTHIYPAPDNQGLGWDNWYRNYNRSDPALNVDVETIDYFIDQVLHNPSNDFSIDTSRVFMSGWSNGAAMAVEYALNTPGIAAAAVYSAPDPYRDYQDPCAQTPEPPYLTPVLILYNKCDLIGICETGTEFIQDLNTRYPTNLTAEYVIFNILYEIVTTCNPLCTTEIGLGLVDHIRWPIVLNYLLFNFLRAHPLR